MAARQLKAEVFRQDAWVLGEGPFWFDDQLWWVDIESGLLLSADAAGKLIQRHAFDQRIGAAVPIDSTNFVVALENELAHLDLITNQWDSLAKPVAQPSGSRFNDGKCDPRGRFLVGTISRSGESGTSALYVLEHGQPLRLLKSGVTISNGLAWSENALYYIDTPTRAVTAFDYDLETGSISRERIALRFSESEGWPDGMTIDREGRLWIAFWDGSAVRCYEPRTGTCEVEIRLPCTRPTSCCFGGENMDQLFITTARVGLSDAELQQQPLAGSVFGCQPGTQGSPTVLFRVGN